VSWWARAKVVKHCRNGHVMVMAWRSCPRCTGAPPETGAVRGEMLSTVLEPRVVAQVVRPSLPEGCVAMLEHERGPGAPRTIPLVPGRYRIGKRPSAEPGVTPVTIEDPYLSRDHAVIEVGAAALVLRDLGSTNGTMVNGRRVERALLERGDVVQLGESTLRVARPDAA
jgi:FHA domain-containing protein